MPGWAGLPAVNSTAWSEVTFLNQFAEALNERELAAKGPSAPQHDTIQLGQTVQSAALVSSWQRSLEGLARYQHYANPYLGLPHYVHYWWTLWSWRAASGIHFDGFTRKFPREIATLLAPGEAGQFARWTGDQQTYTHNGTSWGLAADPMGDPDTIVRYGECRLGDYMGPWLWNEMWQGTNNLTHRLEFMTRTGLTYYHATEFATTSGAAKAAATAAFADVGWNSDQHVAAAALNYHSGIGQWAATLHRTQTSYVVAGHDTIARNAKAYVVHHAASAYGPTPYIYSPQGEPWIQPPTSHEEVYDGPISVDMPFNAGSVPASTQPTWDPNNPNAKHTHGYAGHEGVQLSVQPEFVYLP